MIELSPIIVFEFAGGERFILLRLGSIVNHYCFFGLSEEWFNKIDIIISIIVYLVSMVIYKKINIIISILQDNSFSLEYELHGCECCVLNTTASCPIKEDKVVLIWFLLACLYMPLLWHCRI